MRPLRIAWCIVAVILGAASFAGGDTAIVAGWLFLLWTIPFGVVWWFYLYDMALRFVPKAIAQPLGVVAVIVVTYVFWFVIVPKLRERKRGGLVIRKDGSP